MATRVPFAIKDYNSYITTTDNFLQEDVTPTNGERLGIATGNVTKWHEKREAWDKIYKKYGDPLQCTSTVKEQARTFPKTFATFAAPLLGTMANSENATEDDAAVFRFKIGRKKPTHHVTPLEEKCYATLVQMGGGDIKFKCRTETAAKRAALAPGADSVQVAFTIGTTPPDKIKDTDNEKEFTKAIFIIKCGNDAIRQNLYAFVRWYNTRHPELAGPWSEMVKIIVV